MVSPISPTQLLRLFLSSTFRDMHTERNVLTRLVLPRQRAQLAARNAALQEVDLRWGVTETMAGDSGALAICLRELTVCFPLVLGVLGRRMGWLPPRAVLEAFDPVFAKTVPTTASMTEIEMRYAEHLAMRQGNTKILVLVRSDRLSAENQREESEWVASEALRTWVLASPFIRAVAYDTFEEFELRVESELASILSSQLSPTTPHGAALPVSPEVLRSRELAELECAAGARCPTLVVGQRGTGISWLVRRWVARDPNGLYFDGRALGAGNLAQTLRPGTEHEEKFPVCEDGDRLTRALLGRLTQRSGTRRIVLDHYDDAFVSESRVDLAWIPSKLPRGSGVIVVSRSERLREQALGLGWQLHEIGEIGADQAASFAGDYLRQFAKYLSREQPAILAGAPWSRNFASLVLALDELRRHGAFETLGARLKQLADRRTGVALVEEVIDGLRVVMPHEWRDAVEHALLAMRISVGGLEEGEIQEAVGASSKAHAALPAHLWSAIRVSLASALVARGPLVDVGGGPLLDWLDSRVVAAPDQTRQVAGALRSAFQGVPDGRRWTQAPRLAEILEGDAGLEALLSEPSNMRALTRVGETFADGWLNRLAPEACERVVVGWRDKLAPADADVTWQLGFAAARAGKRTAALALLDLSAAQGVARSTEDDSLVAFIRRDRASLDRLARQLLAESDSGTADPMAGALTALAVLAACAEGLVALDASLEKKLVKAVRYVEQPLLEGQMQLFSGQLLLMRGKWFAAAWAFAAADRAARRLGHARLLCQALERTAAVQLERNKFRAARSAATECLEIARRSRQGNFEALAFERRIEVERRRANWSEAYRLAEEFLGRCREGICDIERAQIALATLEATN
jgi:hypothetical protein